MNLNTTACSKSEAELLNFIYQVYSWTWQSFKIYYPQLKLEDKAVYLLL